MRWLGGAILQTTQSCAHKTLHHIRRLLVSIAYHVMQDTVEAYICTSACSSSPSSSERQRLVSLLMFFGGFLLDRFLLSVALASSMLISLRIHIGYPVISTSVMTSSEVYITRDWYLLTLIEQVQRTYQREKWFNFSYIPLHKTRTNRLAFPWRTSSTTSDRHESKSEVQEVLSASVSGSGIDSSKSPKQGIL